MADDRNLADLNRDEILALYLSEREWREAFQEDALMLIKENDELRGRSGERKPSEVEAAYQAGRCTADITDRGDEHRQSNCTLRIDHVDAHYDCTTGAEWTDETTTFELIDEDGSQTHQRASEEQQEADEAAACACTNVSMGNSLTTHVVRWTADCPVHGPFAMMQATQPDLHFEVPEPRIDAFGKPWPVFYVGDGVCLTSCWPMTGAIRAVHSSGNVDVEWKDGQYIKDRCPVGIRLRCTECRGRLYVLGVLDDIELCPSCSVVETTEPHEDVVSELEKYRVLWSRVSGALCDAGTVDTDDFEKGIRALTSERDRYRASLIGLSRSPV